MRRCKIGDVCKVASGSTPKRDNPNYWGGDIPWATPKEISRLSSPFLVDTLEKITKKGFESCSTEMLPAGSLLLSSRAPIGLLAINTIPVCTNQGFKSLIPLKDVNVFYLYYYLKHNVKKLQARGNGATFKELSKPLVEEFPIIIPKRLDDQIRIAHLLSKVEGLIAQRKQHLKDLDDLVKSVFIQMFGDPVRNERRWDTFPFSKFIDSARNGLSPSKGGKHNGKVYTLSAITGECFKEVFKDDTFSKTTEPYLPSGDEFLVCRGNGNLKLVGKGYFYPAVQNDVIFPDTIIALKIKDESINKNFLEELWKTDFIRRQIENSARTANGTFKINQSSLSQISLRLPPNEMQLKYSSVVQKISKIRRIYLKSLSDLESLYGALSQKAFKGELDLSRIPMEAPSAPLTSTAEAPSDPLPAIVEQLNALNKQLPTLKELFQRAQDAPPTLPGRGAILRLQEMLTSIQSPLEQLGKIGYLSRTLQQVEDPAFKASDKLLKLCQSLDRVSASQAVLEKNTKYLNAMLSPFEAMQKALRPTLAALDATTRFQRDLLPEPPLFKVLRQSSPKHLLKDAMEGSPARLLKDAWERNPAHMLEKAFSSSIPGLDWADYQHRPINADTLLDLLHSTKQALSFEEILTQLMGPEGADTVSYEAIKDLLFGLITNGKISQNFDKDSKTIVFQPSAPKRRTKS